VAPPSIARLVQNPRQEQFRKSKLESVINAGTLLKMVPRVNRAFRGARARQYTFLSQVFTLPPPPSTPVGLPLALHMRSVTVVGPTGDTQTCAIQLSGPRPLLERESVLWGEALHM